MGAQHEVLNVLGVLDFPGAVLSGASLNPCKNKRQRRPGEGCPKGCFELCFATCINAKPYKEQGWEKTRGEHSFLNRCSFRGAGITAT